MPLVSVIMPSYNHERFISESIESVLGQSFSDLELIIIDDASEDNSRHIIEEFSKKDGRIKTMFHEKNLGIARTMNDGIEAAKGKFISFTASDDVWVKDKLEKQVRVLEQDEDFVVWAEAEIIDAEGSPTGELFTQKSGASNRRKSGYIFEELLRGNFIGDRILKKENLRDIKFNEALRYLNDYQLDVDLARRYIYHFIPEPLVKHRIHGSNTIHRDLQGYSKDTILLWQYFLNEYPNDMSNAAKSRIYFFMAQYYRELDYKELGNQDQAKDFLHSARYFITNYSYQTSKKEMGVICLDMVSAYLSLGNDVQAVKCLYTAVKLDPSLLRTLLSRLNPKSLVHILRSLVAGKS